MGIPGFFRWLSLKYPHIVETVKKSPRNKTDFLYLDINAFFHVALRSKVKGKPIKNMAPRRMLGKVFAEMDTAFNITDPQVLIYIAMDGVAPRAKMNEQRSRRFMSQEEDKKKSEKKKEDSKQTINIEKPIIEKSIIEQSTKSGFFVPVDNVSISAGTEFMQAANEAIKFYIYQRLNGKHRNIQIIFNDSKVAGEGEHKVFRFLNAQRNHPNYNSKHKHVVCGGDADFIMYALLTHEPSLRILRPGLEGKDIILHINKLRKHIIHDMIQQEGETSTEINEDNIIDDFVCIAFLLGNDFLPRLTHLGETRVDLLYDAYSRYFKQEKQYITKKDGTLNLKMFLKFLVQLSKLKPGTIRRGSSFPEEIVKDETIIAKRANDYLKTICWTFQYYNGDCPSWRYFYAHHRPPTIPEILKHVKVENFDQTFKKDLPLRPFEQLICILPPNANYLVPAPFRPLFTNPDSPLKEYFPKTFKTSNHKALLPFVDEEHLIQAMKPGYTLLKKEDTLRDMLNGRTHIYAGRYSASYSAVFSLCSGRCRVPNFPISSVVFGKLLYDGPMLKSIEPPVDEFQKINRNCVAMVQYQLPFVPKNEPRPFLRKFKIQRSKQDRPPDLMM
ncbi:hypothetical protein Glove_757g13 [Diversispora epigaea]|uniref:Uncharacterized protein n=1 Tax=Diversispora epigaea TaxID=1348612 RepID=A0A397G222_9GLOM|nr:hypothetical protein Glove_757g13 [Diversispora epigaea]